MRKGISLPVVIIIALFALIPAIYVLLSLKTSEQSTNSVLSYHVVSPSEYSVVANVTSTKGTWDLYEYFCTDYTACAASDDAGYLVEKLSGGIVEDHDVFIAQPDEGNYKYIKLYVKPGWGSFDREFIISVFPEAYAGSIVRVGDNPLVILPLDQAKSLKEIKLSFSDQE